MRENGKTEMKIVADFVFGPNLTLTTCLVFSLLWCAVAIFKLIIISQFSKWSNLQFLYLGKRPARWKFAAFIATNFFFANLKRWIFHLIFSFRLVSAFATFVDVFYWTILHFIYKRTPWNFPLKGCASSGSDFFFLP